MRMRHLEHPHRHRHHHRMRDGVPMRLLLRRARREALQLQCVIMVEALREQLPIHLHQKRVHRRRSARRRGGRRGRSVEHGEDVCREVFGRAGVVEEGHINSLRHGLPGRELDRDFADIEQVAERPRGKEVRARSVKEVASANATKEHRRVRKHSW